MTSLDIHNAGLEARAVLAEVDRQDAKYGGFGGVQPGRARLALACLEDEVNEALEAWRLDRKSVELLRWAHTRQEVLQVAAVAIRALRDAL